MEMEIDPTWCPDLANLVEELVVHIFEFLAPKEIYISSMTCKRFREIAKTPKLALADNLMDMAMEELNKENYPAAMKTLNAIIHIQPSYWRAYRKRNDCWSNQGEILNALEDLQTAERICEEQPYKHLIRSDICCITEQYKDALQEINKAIESLPSELIFYHQRGYIQGSLAAEDRANFDREMEDYNFILKHPYKRISMIYNNMGYVYEELEDVEKAVQYYGKSIQLCPHFIKAYHNRSIVFYYSDDYEAADKDCETIFSINPDFAPAYAWRGSSRLGIDYADASKYYHTAFHLSLMQDNFIANTFMVTLIKLGKIPMLYEESELALTDYINSYNNYLALESEEKPKVPDPENNPTPRYRLIQKKLKQLRKLITVSVTKRAEVFCLTGDFTNAKTEMQKCVVQEQEPQVFLQLILTEIKHENITKEAIRFVHGFLTHPIKTEDEYDQIATDFLELSNDAYLDLRLNDDEMRYIIASWMYKFSEIGRFNGLDDCFTEPDKDDLNNFFERCKNFMENQTPYELLDAYLNKPWDD
jgi:tetratricopeptide (TPR) repeat protein